MLIVISPAKKLDFESENYRTTDRQPAMMDQTKLLLASARKLKSADLKAMMGISDSLADLNVARFQAFTTPFTPANARPALDAFNGDVYVGLDAGSMSDADRTVADQKIRILSGLYGVLKPLDLMQAYRLEMGIKFKSRRGETLYDFWGSRIADQLKADLGDDKVLVNLASTEYFKAVPKKALGKDVRVITPTFKEIKEGQARIISFFAKKARGMMARYAVDKRIDDVEALKDFAEDGYAYNEALSKGDTWVFTR